MPPDPQATLRCPAAQARQGLRAPPLRSARDAGRQREAA